MTSLYGSKRFVSFLFHLWLPCVQFCDSRADEKDAGVPFGDSCDSGGLLYWYAPVSFFPQKKRFKLSLRDAMFSVVCF